ncbi:glycosyltransferase family 4 protein [Massilimicrobiota sp. SW1139]|uniref:glycosyltransferase family 4 protein n=1 Tax=Massilimicrobiota sp. SW1139 TaxID=2530043 RepID=UPI001439E082|nr:glycosyltransferase family 4 protein [Massilimicrobiota sp. SW1139]NJE43791.1 glycosyltransferase family 1 protein [Massilimicrobiota sp. SW1139]
MGKEKVLILASVASMIDQFNMSNINILLSLEYEVHVACNFEKGNTCSVERVEKLKRKLEKLKVKYHQIDFTRSVFNISQDIKAYKQINKIMMENKYKFIHCHSPIGGVVGRLACKSTHTKCIYTAHGFHFYKGGPAKSWLLFYPIEKYLSKYTDILITINEEDFSLAKSKFYASKVYKVPGVGVDTKKYIECNVDKEEYRKKLGINISDFVIISVGELSNRKNHSTIIKAISKLNNPKIKYLIVGMGNKKNDLEDLICKLHLEEKIFLLGFRSDIPELCHCADIYAFPSKREGLGLAAIEGMASGLPLLSSNINGINDYSINGKTGFSYSPDDYIGFSKGIEYFFQNPTKRQKISDINMNIAKKYDISNVDSIMLKIYKSM